MDSLLFPIDSLDTIRYPFVSLMTFFLQKIIWLNRLYLMLPILLAWAISLSASKSISRTVGIFALICSAAIMMTTPYIDLEQLVITSSALTALGGYCCFANMPKTQIVVVSAAACVLSHSKGICIPFCLLLFAVLFYKYFNHKKTRLIVSVCFAFFLISGITWSVVASRETGYKIFFTESGNRLIPNLVAGAYGFVETTEGDTIEAFGINENSVQEAFKHSANVILKNPANYVSSIFKRILFLSAKLKFTFPVLFIIFLCSCLNLGTIRRYAVIYLATIYFFCIYIIMPVETRYFIPSLYLMAIADSLFAADLLMKFNLFKLYSTGKTIICLDRYLAKLDNYAPKILILGSVAFHFALWFASICLLATYPIRKGSFNIEKAMSRHPDNVFLIQKAFSYGLLDFDEFAEKISDLDDSTAAMGRRSLLNFFIGCEEQETKEASPSNWADMLIEAFKETEQSSEVKKNYDRIENSLLSCMLSSGYVRNDSRQSQSTEMEIANKLAMFAANKCSNTFRNIVLSLPDRHKSLKHKMLNSKAYDLMFADKAQDLFISRSGPDCLKCCVPSIGNRSTLTKCGMDGKLSHNFIDNFEELIRHGISAEYIKKIFELDDPDKKQKRISAAVKKLESVISMCDEDVYHKYQSDSRLATVMKHFSDAAYSLGLVYYLSGDSANSRKSFNWSLKYADASDVIQERFYELKKTDTGSRISVDMIDAYYFMFDEKQPGMRKYKSMAAYNMYQLYIMKGDREKARKYALDAIRYNDGYDANPSMSSPMHFVDIGRIYAETKKAGSKKELDTMIDWAISVLEGYLNMFGNDSTATDNMNNSRHRDILPEAAHHLYRLYMIKGDRSKARKYVLDTIRYNEGTDSHPDMSNPMWVIDIGRIYSEAEKAESKTEKDVIIGWAINVLEDYLETFGNASTATGTAGNDRHRDILPEAAYHLYILYSMKGNRNKARKYVLDTIKYCRQSAECPDTQEMFPVMP